MTSLDELLQASHHLASLGLSPGSTGNVSCRMDGAYYMSRSGSQLATLTAADMALWRGKDRGWEGPKPTKEFPLHMALYERNPETECVIHLHSPNASAAACLEPWSDFSALPPFSPYFVMRVGNFPMISYRRPGDPVLGELLRKVRVPFDCALLANHGLLASGSVAEATERCIEIENAAELTMRLYSLKPDTRPRMLSEDACLDLAERNGRPWEQRDFR